MLILLCSAEKGVHMENPQWAGRRKQKASFNHTQLPSHQQALKKKSQRAPAYTLGKRSKTENQTSATQPGDLRPE